MCTFINVTFGVSLAAVCCSTCFSEFKHHLAITCLSASASRVPQPPHPTSVTFAYTALLLNHFLYSRHLFAKCLRPGTFTRQPFRRRFRHYGQFSRLVTGRFVQGEPGTISQRDPLAVSDIPRASISVLLFIINSSASFSKHHLGRDTSQRQIKRIYPLPPLPSQISEAKVKRLHCRLLLLSDRFFFGYAIERWKHKC